MNEQQASRNMRTSRAMRERNQVVKHENFVTFENCLLSVSRVIQLNECDERRRRVEGIKSKNTCWKRSLMSLIEFPLLLTADGDAVCSFHSVVPLTCLSLSLKILRLNNFLPVVVKRLN